MKRLDPSHVSPPSAKTTPLLNLGLHPENPFAPVFWIQIRRHGECGGEVGEQLFHGPMPEHVLSVSLEENHLRANSTDRDRELRSLVLACSGPLAMAFVAWARVERSFAASSPGVCGCRVSPMSTSLPAGRANGRTSWPAWTRCQ